MWKYRQRGTVEFCVFDTKQTKTDRTDTTHFNACKISFVKINNVLMNLHKMEKYLQHIHHLQKVIFTAYRLGLWNQRKGKQQSITVYSVHCCSLRILFDMQAIQQGENRPTTSHHITQLATTLTLMLEESHVGDSAFGLIRFPSAKPHRPAHQQFKPFWI